MTYLNLSIKKPRHAAAAATAAALFLAGCASVPSAPPSQSQKSFDEAISEVSSAPKYVKIALLDDNGITHVRCTVANFLMAAVLEQNQLDFNPAGFAEALRIARASGPDHRFYFSHAVLNKIKLEITDADLDAARKRVAPYSNQQLLEAFTLKPKKPGSQAGSDYPSLQPKSRPEVDALACAIIERGLTPFKPDMGGPLGVMP